MQILTPEMVPIGDLKKHPRNYRKHPKLQLEHIAASIERSGFYRNIVRSRDGFILAGHGVVLAAEQLGAEVVPVATVDFDHDDTRALAVLAADNYVSHLAEDDDRALTDMLREINLEIGLEGTGFDASMVAALAMVTRTAGEMQTMNEAEEWATGGMAETEELEKKFPLNLSCETEDDRRELVRTLGLIRPRMINSCLCARYPPRDDEDLDKLKLEG